MELALKLFVLITALVIVVRAEPALNRMDSRTPILVRLSFLMLTLGAVAEILFLLSGEMPSWSTAIVFAGIAVLLVCERRLRLLDPAARKRAQ